MNTKLTADLIMNRGKNLLDVERIDVPEWGGYVYHRLADGTDLNAYHEWMFKVDAKGVVSVNRKNLYARWLVIVLCDENGELLFTLNDVEKLGRQSSKVLARLFDITQAKNGQTKQSAEEIEKNLERGGVAISISPSPEN